MCSKNNNQVLYIHKLAPVGKTRKITFKKVYQSVSLYTILDWPEKSAKMPLYFFSLLSQNRILLLSFVHYIYIHYFVQYTDICDGQSLKPLEHQVILSQAQLRCKKKVITGGKIVSCCFLIHSYIYIACK